MRSLRSQEVYAQRKGVAKTRATCGIGLANIISNNIALIGGASSNMLMC
jgi:hypothetical protein